MISVKKNFADVPAGLTRNYAVTKQQALMKEGNQHKYSSDVYRHVTVTEVLNNIYHNKCAYCEGLVCEGFTPQVEHYRPKNKLKDDSHHSGYYWLAYQWSNLLLACGKCNRNKSNAFPFAGVRVNHPQEDEQQWYVRSSSFEEEKALLLNPELDQPEQHFDFKPDGTIISGTDKGKATINLCNLNRESLKLARKKVLDEIDNNLRDQLLTFLKHQDEGVYSREKYAKEIELAFKTVMKSFKQTIKPQQPYSAFSTYLFTQFQLVICQPIAKEFEDDNFSKVLIDAYQKFTN